MTDEQLIAQLRQQARGVRCSIAMEQNVYQICDRLIAANQQRQQMIELIDRIVIDEGIDAGVILLDSESRTHYEERNGRQVSVYNNEFFSELGDALVALSRLIKGTAADRA